MVVICILSPIRFMKRSTVLETPVFGGAGQRVIVNFVVLIITYFNSPRMTGTRPPAAGPSAATATALYV